MKSVNIETLTPVHIGSGRELMSNTEYVLFAEKDDKTIAVIDEEKVLKIIGAENINNWMSIINNNQSLKDYLLKRKVDLKPNDIRKRSITAFGEDLGKNKTLKEQLHDGRQIPYIPGSSIKGAIRTAILAQKALQNTELASKNLKNEKGFYNSQVLEKRFFGENPNTDIFRFLQVGDAFFSKGTVAMKAGIFNKYRSNWDFKKDGFHLVECIAEKEKANLSIKIDKKGLELLNSNKDADFLNSKKLFSMINNHTKSLLDKEINFWQNEKAEKIVDFEYYMERINELVEISKNCKENEAVLRIGFGSGWDYITGSWVKNPEITSDYEFDKLVNFIRRKTYNGDVPFPKTRKFDQDGDLLGFVKFTIEE